MTDQPENTAPGQRPEWLEEDLRKAESEEDPGELDMSRAWRFTQPLGINEDGSRQPEITPEQVQRQKDLREGRITLEGPVDFNF